MSSSSCPASSSLASARNDGRRGRPTRRRTRGCARCPEAAAKGSSALGPRLPRPRRTGLGGVRHADGRGSAPRARPAGTTRPSRCAGTSRPRTRRARHQLEAEPRLRPRRASGPPAASRPRQEAVERLARPPRTADGRLGRWPGAASRRQTTSISVPACMTALVTSSLTSSTASSTSSAGSVEPAAAWPGGVAVGRLRSASTARTKPRARAASSWFAGRLLAATRIRPRARADGITTPPGCTDCALVAVFRDALMI